MVEARVIAFLPLYQTSTDSSNFIAEHSGRFDVCKFWESLTFRQRGLSTFDM